MLLVIPVQLRLTSASILYQRWATVSKRRASSARATRLARRPTASVGQISAPADANQSAFIGQKLGTRPARYCHGSATKYAISGRSWTPFDVFITANPATLFGANAA